MGADEDLRRLIESAEQLGVEMDEAEALQWLAAMAAGEGGHEVVLDPTTGVYGHRVTMLDFSSAELERFRDIGTLVEIEDVPGSVETALALSGSAAQSKIQTHPGDADFFERVNIHAPTREEACRLLGDLLREKVLATASGPTYRFIEAKMGSYPEDLVVRGREVHPGTPITWLLPDIRAGAIPATRPGGEEAEITWERAAEDPGWCKLDWVVADPIRHQVANASNMLDVTWETPEGDIVPLDGQLDPYFQEVYLDAASIPIFSKIAKRMLPEALDDYVEQLEAEVRKYTGPEPNYGKAAKRMYNVFRFSGRYREAAYIRELFDEPATVLYQVAALVRSVDEAADRESEIPIETLVAQVRRLKSAVTDAVRGEESRERIVRTLTFLRDHLEEDTSPIDRAAHVHEAREEVEGIVNRYFENRLVCIPEIKSYLDGLAG